MHVHGIFRNRPVKRNLGISGKDKRIHRAGIRIRGLEIQLQANPGDSEIKAQLDDAHYMMSRIRATPGHLFD